MVGIPREARCRESPMPDNMSNWGVLTVPAAMFTSLVALTTWTFSEDNTFRNSYSDPIDDVAHL